MLNNLVIYEQEGYIYVKYSDSNYKKGTEVESESENKIGTKFYGILFIDRLKLFSDHEHANNFKKYPQSYEYKPLETHMIYRMSKTGLVAEDYHNLSFSFMTQNNHCKMEQILFKITIHHDDANQIGLMSSQNINKLPCKTKQSQY